MDWGNVSFDVWMEAGVINGFVGAPICSTHDGLPTSAEEDELLDEGDDICLHILRLYESKEHKEAIEENHSPSVWRKKNAGL